MKHLLSLRLLQIEVRARLTVTRQAGVLRADWNWWDKMAGDAVSSVSVYRLTRLRKVSNLNLTLTVCGWTGPRDLRQLAQARS